MTEATRVELLRELGGVVRCPHCRLNQYARATCRRCKRPLLPEPEAEPAPAEKVIREPLLGGTLPIATVVFTERTRQGISQRRLAARMKVPRSYISKIEGNCVIPQLESLAKFGKALGLTASELVRRAEMLQVQSRAMRGEVDL